MRIELIVSERRYKGFIIQTVVQGSGRKTFDIQYPDGYPMEWGVESLRVAREIVDAEVE